MVDNYSFGAVNVSNIKLKVFQKPQLNLISRELQSECMVKSFGIHTNRAVQLRLLVVMSPLRRHIFVCFMAKSAFLGGFSALAPYTGVGPI